MPNLILRMPSFLSTAHSSFILKAWSGKGEGCWLALSQNFLSREQKHHYAGYLPLAPKTHYFMAYLPLCPGGWPCRNVSPFPLTSSWVWPMRSPGGRPEEGRRRSKCSSVGFFPIGLPLAGCVSVISPLTVVYSE